MKRLLAIVLVLCMLSATAVFAAPSVNAAGTTEEFSKNSTPPNEIGITRMLKQNGVIDSDATQEAIEKAVKSYIQEKLVKNQPKAKDKELLLKALNENGASGIEYGNLLHGRKLGKETSDVQSIEKRDWDGDVRTAKMLILLAEFGEKGPLHNEIERPDESLDSDLWVEDFSTEHYQQMLFTEGGYDAIDHRGETLHLDSMVDYYLEQSCGSYKVEGDVFGWYELPHSEAYYGDDDVENGGHDNLKPGTAGDLVRDLLKVAVANGVPFEDYDLEDPFDLDGDENFDEADGIIDHLVIVHAGMDQSGGGGAQGDDAIWAHSSSVFEELPCDNPTVDYWDGNMIAYNYIIQGEDGGIGVFCHEFGHDIGLPDEYDTIYSGNGEPVGFYSLMSSGSWTGKPLGTKPAPMSPWARWTLGQLWGGQWIQPTVVNSKNISKDGMTFELDETTSLGGNHQAVKVNLPKKTKYLTTPYEGSYEWYGGKGDEIDNTIAVSLSLPAASEIVLDFQTWYDIEEDWDFGFAQVSTDGGLTWASLVSGRTTDSIVSDGYPAIKPNMPGYTGSSDGWVNEVIDLTAYAGQDIMLQFRYMTDWGTSLAGFYVDDIKVIADGNTVFADNAENGGGQWTNKGWSLSEGFEKKDHYYLLEWRNHNNTDEALTFGYNWNGDIAEYFQHDPGMLVWYRDTSYDDNWVGEHPGQGFLGIVDAHPQPLVEMGTAIRTRIQIHDAAFSLDRSEDKEFTFYGRTQTVQTKQAVPEFNDAHSYWIKKAPHSGIKVPDYGLKFKVIGNSDDYTVGEIAIYK